MASCCRGLELHDLYSRFDEVFNAPFGYTMPRDRVVVIPDSAYMAAQERQNAQRVARLEARRAEHLSVVDQLEKQIAELPPCQQEPVPDKGLAAAET
ncbi:guanylate-binding protein [Prochlorococcus marinus]